MPRTKVLITVTTYPLPSRSYDELVCTAGMLENGEWIRIYPVPLSFLVNLKTNLIENVKYTWIELELQKRTDDFRPESYSPVHYDFRDLVIHDRLNTKNNWEERKKYCLRKVYSNLEELINLSKAPTNFSLATFKPSKILAVDIEKDDDDWKEVWKALRTQLSLFPAGNTAEPKKMIPKVPYKFFYRFIDDKGKESRMMIEDWEIGALYWNCLRASNNNEQKALEKVKEQYFNNFTKNNDVFLFLGTTKEWHMRRGKNPFVIIGVFYPLRESQLRLF